MSKQTTAIPTWHPPSLSDTPTAFRPDPLRWPWRRKASPSRTIQAVPALAITWTPPRPDYEAKLHRWRPFSAPTNRTSRWRWLTASKGAPAMTWAATRKRWRPQTAR